MFQLNGCEKLFLKNYQRNQQPRLVFVCLFAFYSFQTKKEWKENCLFLGELFLLVWIWAFLPTNDFPKNGLVGSTKSDQQQSVNKRTKSNFGAKRSLLVPKKTKTKEGTTTSKEVRTTIMKIESFLELD